jgi:hypothetical protein
VVSYGHVKDIVQGGGGSQNDPGTHNASKAPCWIAEALYGVDAPRTLLVRAWLAEAYDRKCRGSFLIGLYARYGRTIAALIRSGRVPGRLFVPLFDYLVVRANADTSRALKRGR